MACRGGRGSGGSANNRVGVIGARVGGDNCGNHGATQMCAATAPTAFDLLPLSFPSSHSSRRTLLISNDG